MSTVDRKELMNEVYDAALFTQRALGNTKQLQRRTETFCGNGRRTNVSEVCTKQKVVTYRPIR